MGDYEDKDFFTGGQFTAADADAMSDEIEEQEAQQEAADAAIAALENEVNQVFQEWIGQTGPGGVAVGGAFPIPLDDNGNRPIGVIVTQVPAGNAGGSGARGAAGNVRCGGGAAGSSPQWRDAYMPIDPSDTHFRVDISPGGVGGASVTTDNTPGNPGTAPGGTISSQFRLGSSAFTWRAATRAWANSTTLPGQGGTIGASSGTGTGGIAYAGGPFSGINGPAASTTGGVGGTGVSTTAGQVPSAGAGGGITAANVANNGGPGGISYSTTSNFAAAAGGIVGGANPQPGELISGGIAGNGSGGGAASTTGPAQAGADGVGYGSPGAGGGASVNGQPSGKGGDGGPGYVSARWVYA